MSVRVLTRLLLAAAFTVAAGASAQEGMEEGGDGRPPGGYDVQVDVEGAAPVTLQSFEAGLAPYGDWVQARGYGSAWRPRVATGWRPYYYGRWEWTNEGWLWVSEEPFGWATYHYGRWAWDTGYGWVWVPGYQWAPAWVSWRYGSDVVGWAPLAPGLSLYVTAYAFVDFWWTFVPTVRFCGAPVWGVAYPPGRAYQFYGVTSPAPPRPRPPGAGQPDRGGTTRPPGSGHPTPAWGGPSPRFIESRSGRPVSTSRIVPESRPGAARGRPGEIGVYRPETGPRGGGAARPMPAGQPMSPARPAMPEGRTPPGSPHVGGDTMRPVPSAPSGSRHGGEHQPASPPPRAPPPSRASPPPRAPTPSGPPTPAPSRSSPSPRGSWAPPSVPGPGGGSWRQATGRAPSSGGEAPRGGGSRPGGGARHR